MNDRRETAANARVAHVSLRGKIDAPAFVEGEWARVTAPLADLLTAPRGLRDRQLLHGERVLVLERRAHMAFLRAEKDGFCGYVAEKSLGPDRAATHWVSAPATHLYPLPSLKSPATFSLSLGARLTIAATHPRFLETTDGLFAPHPHLSVIGDWARDPASIAEKFLGTPYFWGGNSRAGIDCSGLIQAALTACNIACPGDADQQRAALGRDLPPGAHYQRGDLFFWGGHVAMATAPDTLIHSNGFHMAVGYESIESCIARIDRQGEGPLLAVRRL